MEVADFETTAAGITMCLLLKMMKLLPEDEFLCYFSDVLDNEYLKHSGLFAGFTDFFEIMNISIANGILK